MTMVKKEKGSVRVHSDVPPRMVWHKSTEVRRGISVCLQLHLLLAVIADLGIEPRRQILGASVHFCDPDEWIQMSRGAKASYSVHHLLAREAVASQTNAA